MAIDIEKGVTLIVALSVLILLAAFVVPVGINAMMDDTTKTFTSNETDTEEVNSQLNVTLNDVTDTGAEEINVTLDDSVTGESKDVVVSNQSTKTVTLNSENVTVGMENKMDNDTATYNVSYPQTYTWSDGAKQLFDIIPLIFILGLVLLALGWAVGMF